MNDAVQVCLDGLFARAFAGLGITSSQDDIASYSELIYQCMSGDGRKYHDIEHVFDIVAAITDPVQMLAAAFHDAVYYQIDGGLSEGVRKYLGTAITERDSGVVLDAGLGSESGNELDAMVVEIFGFVPGQAVPPGAGLNEFLSSLLAARSLAPLLPRDVLARIAACIEATIPFRTQDAAGRPAAEGLFERLTAASQRFDLDMTSEQIEAAVHCAVDLANRDVANFADDDIARFLGDTWELLPESNDALRSSSDYTVGEYRFALYKMQRFFASVTADRVFTAFRGRPAPEELAALIRKAARNIDIGHRYLSAKLVTASILTAIAELTGGDAPIALFMGELRWVERSSPGIAIRGDSGRRLESFLPSPWPLAAADVFPDLLQLFTEGRASDSGFDLRHAPVTAFVYSAIGEAGVTRALSTLEKKPVDWLGWLADLPEVPIAALLAGCKALIPERTAALVSLEKALAARQANSGE